MPASHQHSELALGRPALLLAVLGLLLGPLYYFFGVQLNNQLEQQFTLTERAPRWSLPDGTILRFSRNQGYRPESIALDPSMNGLAARLTFEFPANAAGKPGRADYELSVLQGDQTIFHQTLTVDAAPGRTAHADSRRFEVYFPGSYVLLLEEPPGAPVPGATVRLELFKGVRARYMPLVWSGFALLAAAGAVAVYALATGRPLI
jgi:hypothetical protein